MMGGRKERCGVHKEGIDPETPRDGPRSHEDTRRRRGRREIYVHRGQKRDKDRPHTLGCSHLRSTTGGTGAHAHVCTGARQSVVANTCALKITSIPVPALTHGLPSQTAFRTRLDTKEAWKWSILFHLPQAGGKCSNNLRSAG